MTAQLAYIIAGLSHWLDTMRSPEGYTGPVVHWWQNCLHYTGAGLDWRYEGIIIAHLELYRKTGDGQWLLKAQRAGDDLVRAQIDGAHYRNSSFELNPYAGGTPHEAAASLGLLYLAEITDGKDSPYFKTAQRNLETGCIARLWDEERQYFRDHPKITGFVPNKAATLAEALFKLAHLSGDDCTITRYALPTLDAVLKHQVQERGVLFGGIYQYSDRDKFIPWFFPYYIARCIPALQLAYAHTGDERYAQGAENALEFVQRWGDTDGGYVQVVYPQGKVNRYPRWISASGDILRIQHQITGGDAPLDWLIRGASPTGAIATAHGFASQINQRKPKDIPDFRDLLPVCGWVDKAFRCLVDALPDGVTLPTFVSQPYTTVCLLRGRKAEYYEDDERIELRQKRQVVYRWLKGTTWAEIHTPELLWK
jgi:hypothetical protein